MIRFSKLMIIYIILLTSISYDCASNRNQPSEKTIPSEKKADDTHSPLPPPPLPPGTARTNIEILGCEEKNDHYICLFRVKEVYEYGSATPPLPPGTEINVEVTKYFLQQNHYHVSEILKNGNRLDSTLKHRHHPDQAKTSFSWRVIQFK